MTRINEIVDTVLQNFPEADPSLLQRAYVYSAKVHQGQTRLSGEPYLTHPLAVAKILADMRLDQVTVAAGLLHDTVEDTYATEEEVVQQFGPELGHLVVGLTKLSKIEFQSREERQAENFRKMLIAMAQDIRVLLIKLADRLHNMKTLDYMSEDARRRISRETLDIYAPLAHRLGIYWMKEELEGRAFRELYPEVYKSLAERIQGSKKEREEYVKKVVDQLHQDLAAEGIKAEVTGRPKEMYSLYKKMERQRLDLDQIYDLIAFRIIVEGDKTTCYRVLGVVHGLFKPVPGRIKEYIAMPKPNGYQSLHTTVIGGYGERMEVQIRTQEMHRVAEFGIAAHWKYKEGSPPQHGEDDQKFAWLRQLLEWHQSTPDPNEFLETVRVDLFADEVYVFTPQGDVIALPTGATPIDFAYAVHTEVGHHCSGAKINGHMVPLRAKLSNGDTIEIITSNHQTPRQEWLDVVVTGRARSRIRHRLKTEQVEHSRKLGRELLTRALKQHKESYEQLLRSGELKQLAREFSFKDIDGLLQAIAYGKLSAKQVLRKRIGAAEDVEETEKGAAARSPTLFERVFRSKRPDSPGVRVGGLDDTVVRFARCCSPIPGDPVEGFITRGRGVTVHTRDCPKVFHLDPERRVPVTWGDGAPQDLREVRLRVVSQDRPGLLAAVSNLISAENINIQGATVTTNNSNAVQLYDLSVKDRKHLDAVMKSISKLRGVLSVERVRS
jgi:GTP diphosphokinase / guanosine-3',5'-bis(diphosphate) 3'-diphosphatase